MIRISNGDAQYIRNGRGARVALCTLPTRMKDKGCTCASIQRRETDVYVLTLRRFSN
jgi:hypothetical protein